MLTYNVIYSYFWLSMSFTLVLWTFDVICSYFGFSVSFTRTLDFRCHLLVFWAFNVIYTYFGLHRWICIFRSDCAHKNLYASVSYFTSKRFIQVIVIVFLQWSVFLASLTFHFSFIHFAILVCWIQNDASISKPVNFLFYNSQFYLWTISVFNKAYTLLRPKLNG